MRTPPPSASRMRAHALRMLSGKEIDDWDLHWLCEENQLYKQQLNALLMEPFKQHDYEVATAAETARVAAIQHRKALVNTCRSYRSTRVARAKRHRNHYPMLLRLQRNEVEKQKMWDRFLVSIREYRTLVCLDWIDRRKADWMTQVVWSAPNPFEPIDAFPYGSQCVIDPVMSKDWVMLEAPIPATVISVVKSPAYWKSVEIEVQNRMHQLMAGIQPLKNITLLQLMSKEPVQVTAQTQTTRKSLKARMQAKKDSRAKKSVEEVTDANSD